VVASPVSGAKTAAIVALSMVLVGLAVPSVLNLPSLVEVELVVACWWLLWGGVGTVLLYRSFRVADDHVLARPRLPWAGDLFGKNLWEQQSRADGSCLGCSGCFPSFELLVPFVILVVAFGLSWLMVEVVLPLVFFLVYLSVRAGLSAIANDDHDCQGHLGRALGWGFLWASVFVLPLAGTLALIRGLFV
jgi:hypothetical protein